MKKILSIILCIIPGLVFSQANITSLGFNYSALVRDTAGRAQPKKQVELRFTLIQGQSGSVAGSPWIETQKVETDSYGFVNVVIGNGTKKPGIPTASFADVDFTIANYWILIEVFNTFTNTYDALAKQPFQSVPYAKVAGTLAGSSALPPGAIIAFGGDSARVPQGWLLCDGRELDNTDTRYINLFNAIKYNWGTSNNTTKFNIPETRGFFLRGVNNNSGNDPDIAERTFSAAGGNIGDNVGSKQPDQFGKHAHYWGATRQEAGTDDNNNGADFSRGDRGNYENFTRGTNEQGGNETRPKNVYVNYIIKL